MNLPSDDQTRLPSESTYRANAPSPPDALDAEIPGADDALELPRAADVPARRSGWNFKALALAVAVAFVLQNIFLPCFCDEGARKMAYAMIFDVLVIVRILIAWAVRESERGYTFYLFLIYTSPLWIKLLAAVYGGH